MIEDCSIRQCENEIFKEEKFIGERALYKSRNVKVYDSVFVDGESHIKECDGIEIYNSIFKWMYPVWYSNNITVKGCSFLESTRAGFWYCNGLCVEDSLIQSPKNFRRCENVSLQNIDFPNAVETLWYCKSSELNNVTVKGDYFGMNCEDLRINGLDLSGKYSFDGLKNAEITNARMITKDCFWNSENVVVKDSVILGEYLGWNSKNLTFINCTIESLQGMCYIDNLKMIDCKLINTTLAFEYSSVEADIEGGIDSVFNPYEGTIKADHIGELTLDKSLVNPSKTKITLRK